MKSLRTWLMVLVAVTCLIVQIVSTESLLRNWLPIPLGILVVVVTITLEALAVADIVCRKEDAHEEESNK